MILGTQRVLIFKSGVCGEMLSNVGIIPGVDSQEIIHGFQELAVSLLGLIDTRIQVRSVTNFNDGNNHFVYSALLSRDWANVDPDRLVVLCGEKFERFSIKRVANGANDFGIFSNKGVIGEADTLP